MSKKFIYLAQTIAKTKSFPEPSASLESAVSHWESPVYVVISEWQWLIPPPAPGWDTSSLQKSSSRPRVETIYYRSHKCSNQENAWGLNLGPYRAENNHVAVGKTRLFVFTISKVPLDWFIKCGTFFTFRR